METEQQNRRPASPYAVLGIDRDASLAEIRSAYRKLAMKWHPDRRGAEPWMVQEANRRFQQIQEAYQVLSDEKRRRLYDSGLYDPLKDEEEEVEGFHDFAQEMASLMASVRKEKKQYSLEELQQMLLEMAQDSGSSSQPCRPADRGPSSKWFPEDMGRQARRKTRWHGAIWKHELSLRQESSASKHGLVMWMLISEVSAQQREEGKCSGHFHLLMKLLEFDALGVAAQILKNVGVGS